MYTSLWEIPDSQSDASLHKRPILLIYTAQSFTNSSCVEVVTLRFLVT